MTRAIFVDVSAAIWITVGVVFRNIAGVIRDRVGIGDNNIGQNIDAPRATARATPSVIGAVPNTSMAAAVTVVRKSNRGQQRYCQAIRSLCIKSSFDHLPNKHCGRTDPAQSSRGLDRSHQLRVGASLARRCPLLGVKRTSLRRVAMSAFDAVAGAPSCRQRVL